MKFKVTKGELKKIILNALDLDRFERYPDTIELEGEPVKENSYTRPTPAMCIGCEVFPDCDCPCECHEEKPKKIEELNDISNSENDVDISIVGTDQMLDKINEIIKYINDHE